MILLGGMHGNPRILMTFISVSVKQKSFFKLSHDQGTTRFPVSVIVDVLEPILF